MDSSKAVMSECVHVQSSLCFSDQLISENGEEAKQERGADAGQQRPKAGDKATQGTGGLLLLYKGDLRSQV